jgi:hypothetical protein
VAMTSCGDFLIAEKPEHFQRSNEHFCLMAPPSRAACYRL